MPSRFCICNAISLFSILPTGSVNGDYWHQLNFAPNRGTLIMVASMMSDRSKNNIWSGGLGVGNYTTEDNSLLRWTAICIANDFENCRTRYFIGIFVVEELKDTNQ